MYLLDSNTFIESKNRFYGLDFCPAFWDWLLVMNQSQMIASVEKVRDELIDKEDELSAWAKKHRNFFITPDQKVLGASKEVNSSIEKSKHYDPKSKARFISKADPWLIASAKV